MVKSIIEKFSEQNFKAFSNMVYSLRSIDKSAAVSKTVKLGSCAKVYSCKFIRVSSTLKWEKYLRMDQIKFAEDSL